jgi:hypothetical protein
VIEAARGISRDLGAARWPAILNPVTTFTI